MTFGSMTEIAPSPIVYRTSTKKHLSGKTQKEIKERKIKKETEKDEEKEEQEKPEKKALTSEHVQRKNE